MGVSVTLYKSKSVEKRGDRSKKCSLGSYPGALDASWNIGAKRHHNFLGPNLAQPMIEMLAERKFREIQRKAAKPDDRGEMRKGKK